MAKIKRLPIGEQVHQALLKKILVGQFSPGTRIRDAAVAVELSVSRTPVREALQRLTREGFLSNDPGRGFSVCPLDLPEIKETYPILSNLEGLAVSMGNALPRSATAKLRKLNKQLSSSSLDPGTRLELDAAWHRALLSGCNNRRLLELIENLRNITRRYEMAYMTDQQLVDKSIHDHEAIISSVERKDTDKAIALIKAHWERSLFALTEKMAEGKEKS